MYGDLGLKLAQHAKRTQGLVHLPPYQTELVRAVTREVRALDKDVSSTLSQFNGAFDPSSNPAVACSLLVDHLCIRRNKRCLLAYHKVRSDRLEEMCWNGQEAIDHPSQPTEAQNEREEHGGASFEPGNSSSLSPEEEDYFRQYGELLATFKAQFMDIDLTGALDPPKDLFIDVRVLKDAGEIQTEYGAITLTKHSQFYVRQCDVEQLITQGYLQKLT